MVEQTKKLKVAILGTGNIGTDLMVKTLRSSFLECTLFTGRNLISAGMTKANSLGVKVSGLGVEAIINDPNCCDLVFDATSAEAHKYHWSLLEKMAKIVIDMTPSRVGEMCIPAINLKICSVRYKNVNMITCGGQAAIPMAYLIGQIHEEVDYIEVISSIASRSAGPATRINIDEYVEATEEGIKAFSGCSRAKVILILNPAHPPVNMQTTVLAKVRKPDIQKLNAVVVNMVRQIQAYVPGYQLIVPPVLENNRIVIMVKIQGLGDYLPKFAGNLDIINCAAIGMAEEYAKNSRGTQIS